MFPTFKPIVSACLSPAQTNAKAAQFRSSRFAHYDHMSIIMIKRVKVTHTFYASEQSQGAASSLHASSSKGKKGKKRGKEKEMGMEVDLELGDNSNNDDNKPAASIPPPGPTIAAPSESISASSISAGFKSKRKFSALDEDGSNLSGSHNNSSTRKSKAYGTAMDGVSAGLKSISSSIHDMTAERKLH
jgi:hypothetical protein